PTPPTAPAQPKAPPAATRPVPGGPALAATAERKGAVPAKTTSHFPAPLPVGPAQEHGPVPPRAPGLDGPGLFGPGPEDKGETEKANPIHLSARSVEGSVLRSPLTHVDYTRRAEAKVAVSQEAARGDVE